MQVGRSYLLGSYRSHRTAFLCCDIQERVRNYVPNFDGAVEVSNKMARLHELMTDEHSVFLSTEHFPEKVGKLAKEIQLPAGSRVFDKFTPPMLTEEVRPFIFGDATHPRVDQVVLWGLETHVCVIQTANALAMEGIKVAVLVDGCGSQRQIEHDMAVLAMSRWENVLVSSTVSVVLQLIGEYPDVSKSIIQLLKFEKK